MEGMHGDPMPGMSAPMPGMSAPANSTAGDMSSMHPHKMMMHMTFFWGKNVFILFPGWPGSDGGMYVLALFFVFALAILVEYLSHCNLIRDDNGSDHVVCGVIRTLMHTARVGLAYMVMLAVMSFNVGVFFVAILGHGVGFLLFATSVFNKSPAPPVLGKISDLPPMTC